MMLTVHKVGFEFDMFEKHFFKIVAVWLLFSFIFLLILEPHMKEVGVISVIGFALLNGLRFVSMFWGANQDVMITAVSSDDGIVHGEIRQVDVSQARRGQWIKPDTPPIFYICRVKRIYDDGVYASEEEFYSLEEAEAWLENTYQEELAKHQSQSLI